MKDRIKKLEDKFKRLDRKASDIENLKLEKEQIEGTYTDNEILQRYIAICKKIEKQEAKLSDKVLKDQLYVEMLDTDKPRLVGNYLSISLTKPYIKTSVDSTKFIKDNKPGSKLYEKYVKETEVKGHVSIKSVEEQS